MIRRKLLSAGAALVLAAFASVSVNALDSKPKAKTGCACCGPACECTSCTCDATTKAGKACDCCGGAACCSTVAAR